jgi:hypothetical protein
MALSMQLEKHLPYKADIIQAALMDLVANDVIQMGENFISQKRMIRDCKLSEIRKNSVKKRWQKQEISNTNCNTNSNTISNTKTDTNTENENEYIYTTNSKKDSKVEEGAESSINYTKTQIPFYPKTTDDMVVVEMIKIFKARNPSYFFDEEIDYPACLQIAYKIAKAKGWNQADVVGDRKNDVLESWKTIVDFIKSDKWLSTRSISDISSGEWQRLVQKMSLSSSEKIKMPNQTLTSPKLKEL